MYVSPVQEGKEGEANRPFFATVPELVYVGVVIVVAIFITAAYANLSGGNVKRFRSIAEAEAWLFAPPDTAS